MSVIQIDFYTKIRRYAGLKTHLLASWQALAAVLIWLRVKVLHFSLGLRFIYTNIITLLYEKRPCHCRLNDL
jgi:hypothetical protein